MNLENFAAGQWYREKIPVYLTTGQPYSEQSTLVSGEHMNLENLAAG